jgi:hypothetical protein
MALVARNAKEQLKIEISRSSSRHSVSSGSSSPKLLSPKDKKARNNFVLSPAMGTELERLKQTYTPVEKILKPPPEERTLLRSFSTNSYNNFGEELPDETLCLEEDLLISIFNCSLAFLATKAILMS